MTDVLIKGEIWTQACIQEHTIWAWRWPSTSPGERPGQILPSQPPEGANPTDSLILLCWKGKKCPSTFLSSFGWSNNQIGMRLISRRETNWSLITLIPTVHMGETQENWKQKAKPKTNSKIAEATTLTSSTKDKRICWWWGVSYRKLSGKAQ